MSNESKAIPTLIQHTLWVEASVRANHEGVDVEKYINDMLENYLKTDKRTYHTEEEKLLIEANAAYENAKIAGPHQLAKWSDVFPMFEFRSDIECIAYKNA